MSELQFVVIGDDLGLDPSVVEKAFTYSKTLLRHPISRMHDYARSLVERGREEPDPTAISVDGVGVIKTVRERLTRLDV
jgi:hypothetical protein